jgi:DHA2 family multidrug resistance protein
MSDIALSGGASAQASKPARILPSDFPTSRKFLIFGVMAFGQFMALIDIQIVAASLNDIQAGLSAGPDEISWVQTGYLMAELVMIPFSAFLGQALSTRWMFALSAGLFTISSALCGMAWDIQSMVMFRLVQGFVGGAMVPTVFATGYALFTGKQRALIPAILGTVSVLAPTLGPTVGGWITDVAGWRWIFYINIVPGIAVTILSLTVIRGIDLPNLSMLKKIDYSHLVSLAVFLGGVEYVLEEGQRHDWFSDPAIAAVGWASFVAFLLFIERSFYSGGAIVRLSPFRKPTFAIACVFNLVIGFGIYASTYLVPVFLGRVRGFDSLQIGLTVFVTGIAQLASVVVASRLSTRVDSRILIAVGLSLFSLSLYMTSYLTPQWGFWELLWPQLVRGFAVLLCIVPSVGMALGQFEGAELRYASGLFNLMRNLGGAIGIALVNVWLYDQTRDHTVRLGRGLGENARSAPDFITSTAARLAAHGADPVHALMMAHAAFARVVGLNTLTLGFDEVFRLMSYLFVAALVMAPFCKPVNLAAPKPPPDAH